MEPSTPAAPPRLSASSPSIENQSEGNPPRVCDANRFGLSPPSPELPLPDFIEILAQARDEASKRPFYRLPAREALCLMTGQGDEDSMKECGEDFYPLKLFEGAEERQIKRADILEDSPLLSKLTVRLDEIILVYEGCGCGGFPWRDMEGKFYFYPTKYHANDFKKRVYIPCEDAIAILESRLNQAPEKLLRREFALWLAEGTISLKDSPYANAKGLNYYQAIGNYRNQTEEYSLDDFLYRWYFSKAEIEAFQPQTRWYNYPYVRSLARHHELDSEDALKRVILREFGRNLMNWIPELWLDTMVDNALYPRSRLHEIFKGFGREEPPQKQVLPQAPQELLVLQAEAALAQGIQVEWCIESEDYGNHSSAGWDKLREKPKPPTMPSKKQEPVSSLPLSEFMECLEHFHNPKRHNPYYLLPVREAVYFMLTGKGSQYAEDWQEDHGPSHGFRLKLFDGNGISTPFDTKLFLEKGIVPEGVYVELSNVCSLFLYDKPQVTDDPPLISHSCHFASVPWKDKDGMFMKVGIANDIWGIADRDCLSHIENQNTKVIDACCDEFLWGFKRADEFKVGSDKAEPAEKRILENLAAHVGRIHQSHSGLDAVLAVEDFLKEEIERYRQKGDDTRREIFENAQKGLGEMAKEDRGTLVFFEPLKTARKAREASNKVSVVSSTPTLEDLPEQAELANNQKLARFFEVTKEIGEMDLKKDAEDEVFRIKNMLTEKYGKISPAILPERIKALMDEARVCCDDITKIENPTEVLDSILRSPKEKSEKLGFTRSTLKQAYEMASAVGLLGSKHKSKGHRGTSK